MAGRHPLSLLRVGECFPETDPQAAAVPVPEVSVRFLGEDRHCDAFLEPPAPKMGNSPVPWRWRTTLGCQKSSPGSRRRWCWTEWAVEKVFLWAVTSLEQTVIAATVGSDHTASYSITPDSAMRLSLLKDPRLICLHESWSSCKYAAVHCSENSISLKASSKTFELGDLLLTSFEA